MRQCRCNVLLSKSQFRGKNPVLPVEKFLFLVQARNIMLKHPNVHFSLHYLSSGRLQEVKNTKVVAYERWSRTRGSKYSDDIWYFGQLVAEERWSLRRGGR